ncbi:MAG: hypothetical protein CSH37_08000, partial [Thalassolituus sp.]
NSLRSDVKEWFAYIGEYMNANTKIKVNDWVPTQIPTPKSLRMSADYHEQHFVKFPHVACFHSRAELYHAAINESKDRVPWFVPQPFRFQIGRTLYTPDCFVQEGTKKTIIEIKRGGRFDKPWRDDFEEYLRLNGFHFQVISNEELYEQEILAENWLTIIRVLVRGQHYDTEPTERRLIEEIIPVEGAYFGELLDRNIPANRHLRELSIFRLLHKGCLCCNLSERNLNFDSWVTPCI